VLSVAVGAGLSLTVHVARAGDPEAVRACIDAATSGQRLRDQGALLAARDAFEGCAAESCPAVVRADCAAWASEVKAEIPALVLGARDASGNDLLDVRVFIDGALVATRLDGRARPLDPGPHRLRFERDGATPITLDVVLRAGERARDVTATFGPLPARESPPVASPSGRAIAFASLAGTALLAAGSLTYFGLRARGEAEDLRARCAPSCTADDTRALRTDLTLADVSIGVAVVSLGALAVVALLPRSRAGGGAGWLAVRPLASGVGFAVGARY
jgi:hypothetical protein